MCYTLEMKKSKNPIQPRHHGTLNGYTYYGCRCPKCAAVAAARRKAYRLRDIEASRAKERKAQKRHMANTVNREKTNKRQMERYYDQLRNPITAKELRDRQHRYYQKNKEQIKTKDNARRKQYKNHLILLLGGKCGGCGVSNALLLDFHHIDPSTKEFEMSRGLAKGGKSLKQLEDEAKKCELLCANCHRLKTHGPQ